MRPRPQIHESPKCGSILETNGFSQEAGSPDLIGEQRTVQRISLTGLERRTADSGIQEHGRPTGFHQPRLAFVIGFPVPFVGDGGMEKRKVPVPEGLRSLPLLALPRIVVKWNRKPAPGGFWVHVLFRRKGGARSVAALVTTFGRYAKEYNNRRPGPHQKTGPSHHPSMCITGDVMQKMGRRFFVL